MTHRTNRRSRAVLLVLVVVALATAGLVYAHWTETLTVDANVATGSMTLQITSAFTNDDGRVDAGSWDAGDDGGGTEFDKWPPSLPLNERSSNDPSGEYPTTTRYTKDVARCRVMNQGIGTLTSTILVENAYPSYHCSIRQMVRNTGTIPVKNQATRVWACGPAEDCSNWPTNFDALTYVRATDRFSYDSGDSNPDFELVMQHNPAGVCGTQFDPNRNFASDVTFHVLQDAAQSGSYVLRFELEEVNWNEYSLANCVGFSNQPNP